MRRLVATQAADLLPGGFRLEKAYGQNGNGRIVVSAIDDRGAMYGLLEVGEQLARFGRLDRVEPGVHNPRLAFRAIKFNLPWSSYRRFPALQANLRACRDLAMWRALLDMMAENRFNALTLWNIHPWPYLVRSESFPEACPFSDQELAEWRAFWKQLFRMAKDRGVDTYLLNWNVFVSESFHEHYGHGNVDTAAHYIEGVDSPEIRRYNRECVTQVINEYPNLTGLGVTLGEGMEGWSSERQVDWVQDVFFRGVHAADRPIKFIYRAALKGDHTINRRAIDDSGIGSVDEPLIVELKFNWSHGHSTPTLVKAHGGGTGEEYWTDPPPSRHKMAWMIRNEDFFRLRWGDPGFIRSHIKANSRSFVAGYFIGSECYIPADDIFHRPDHDHIDWAWAFERQWLFYLQWGRLLYDPDTPDAVFEHAYDQRFAGRHGKRMTKAFELSTRTARRIAGYFSWSWDYTFYTEGFLSKKGFLSLRQIMRTETTDPDLVSVKEFRGGRGDFVDRITPLELADQLEHDNLAALDLVEPLAEQTGPLGCEVADVQAWSFLGLHFAEKLRAAVAASRGDIDEATSHVENAAAYWQRLVVVTEAHLRASSLGHLDGRNFHWRQGLAQFDKDLEWLRNRAPHQP
ncbi:MAG: hypothetical protein AAF596_03955 [Planctomycetota bacterium]